MIETPLSKVLNTMRKYVENIYEHDSEPMLNWKDIKLVLDELERLNNIINELEKWLEKQYSDSGKCSAFARIEDNYEDIRKYTRDFNLYQQCMEKLQELKEGKENE